MAFFRARCNPDGKARWPGYMVSFHPVRYGAVEREVYNSQLLHLCIAPPPHFFSSTWYWGTAKPKGRAGATFSRGSTWHLQVDVATPAY